MGIDGSQIKSTKKKYTPVGKQNFSSNLTTCVTCKKPVSTNAASCPHCGEPLKRSATPAHTSDIGFGTDKILGLVGSAIMAIGVFCPVIKAPVVGTLNYFGNGEGDGVFLLGLAAVTILCTFINKMKYLWITGLAAIGMLGYTFYEFKSRMNTITAEMERDLAGNPFRGLADAAIGAVSIQWGWALLVLGAILILAAATMSDKQD